MRKYGFLENCPENIRKSSVEQEKNMKNLKRILSVILVLTLALSMTAMLAGCKENTPDATEPSGDNTGATGTYNVTVTTAGGLRRQAWAPGM